MKPKIITGNYKVDERGKLTYNNDFNASGIKRIYTIENESLNFSRGWQGHKIEQRWFSAILGSFKINLIQIDDWKNPSKDLPVLEFILHSEKLDFLHIPAGYVTAIQALKEQSKLLLLADYQLNEVDDEFRFPIDYFTKK